MSRRTAWDEEGTECKRNEFDELPGSTCFVEVEAIRETEEPNHFKKLPNEVVNSILEFLPALDILPFRFTCKLYSAGLQEYLRLFMFRMQNFAEQYKNPRFFETESDGLFSRRLLPNPFQEKKQFKSMLSEIEAWISEKTKKTSNSLHTEIENFLNSELEEFTYPSVGYVVFFLHFLVFLMTWFISCAAFVASYLIIASDKYDPSVLFNLAMTPYSCSCWTGNLAGILRNQTGITDDVRINATLQMIMIACSNMSCYLDHEKRTFITYGVDVGCDSYKQKTLLVLLGCVFIGAGLVCSLAVCSSSLVSRFFSSLFPLAYDGSQSEIVVEKLKPVEFERVTRRIDFTRGFFGLIKEDIAGANDTFELDVSLTDVNLNS
jgi:hypothetical protein